MSIKLDYTKRQKDSGGAKQEAQEFLEALAVYPIGCEFSLWNLQGDLGIRMSCERRGKIPAELDFDREIELAKESGWIEERAEDFDFTERHQKMYQQGPIRYGATFVRTARSSAIKSQREHFVSELIAGLKAAPRAGQGRRVESRC